MKNLAKLFLISMLSVSSLYSLEKQAKIRIVVKCKSLPDSTKIYITGNSLKLGNWNPALITLDPGGNHEWDKIFFFDSGETIEFKFTLGEWNSEALKDDGTVPGNNVLTITQDTTLIFHINNWSDLANPEIKGKLTGVVKYTGKFKSRTVKERDIIVWLPPDYEKSTSENYPVLYVHDGQNIFDPATSFTGIDWQIDETADSLIKNEMIKKIIIVGIYNTNLRSKEYSTSDTGYAYMDFIVNELKPYIDKTYRTKPGREHTATLGSSLGGLISFLLAWEKSETFSMAACFSPALKISDYDCTPLIQNYEGKKKDLKFYIYNGGIGLEAMLQPGIDETINLLKERGYTENLKVSINKTAEHNEKSWAKEVAGALIYLWGK